MRYCSYYGRPLVHLNQQLNQELARVLLEIEANDQNYDARYVLVYKALALALEAGLSAGVRVDRDEPDWPVVQIELPTGQVTWHMPAHKIPYDNSSTEEKYRRINEYARMTGL